jgi:xanthine dehydrogenase accessory factor
MMRTDLLFLAADLARRGDGFVLATVVRREPPSSSKVGDTALITQGGAFHGWLGGSCTQPTVVREALLALADGVPRFIALSPDPSSDHRSGVTAFPMTCHSGGSVDIYIEPVLPAPRLIVFGRSPVAQALVRLAKAMGYAVDAVDPEADRAAFPEADRIFTSFDSPQLGSPSGVRGVPAYAVVATMGQRDDEAVRMALGLQAAYIGLVSSRRRFDQIRETLAGSNSSAELDRIKCPAGLDIGSRTPEEIALSVLAEMVQRHRSREAQPAPPPAEASQARDPVCGMSVATATAVHRAQLGGRTYYFCCGGCRDRFVQAPERYLVAAAGGGGK